MCEYQYTRDKGSSKHRQSIPMCSVTKEPCTFIDMIDFMFAKADYDGKTVITKAELQEAVLSHTSCIVI